MNLALRIVLAIATLLTTLCMLGLGIWSLVSGKPALLTIVCAMLSAGFGLFVYHDYQFFFGKKTNDTTKQV